MAARDPETGQFVGDDGEMIDYSSFEYQHISLDHTEQGQNDANSRAFVQLDPLQDSGGLDTNQLAELVAMRVTVDVSNDDFTTVEGSPGTTQFRGVFGVNLNSGDDLLRNTEEVALVDPSQNIEDNGALLFERNSNAQIRITSHDKDEVFHHFQATATSPFDNAGASTGGGGGYTFQVETVAFRDLVGRGPVVDAGDNLSFVTQLVKNRVQAGAEGSVRMTLIWDVSEVNDAARRFSVPQ